MTSNSGGAPLGAPSRALLRGGGFWRAILPGPRRFGARRRMVMFVSIHKMVSFTATADKFHKMDREAKSEIDNDDGPGVIYGPRDPGETMLKASRQYLPNFVSINLPLLCEGTHVEILPSDIAEALYGIAQEYAQEEEPGYDGEWIRDCYLQIAEYGELVVYLYPGTAARRHAGGKDGLDAWVIDTLKEAVIRATRKKDDGHHVPLPLLSCVGW